MDVTYEEKHKVRDILQKVYGPQAMSWKVNEQTLEVFADHLMKVQRLCPAMDLVPRYLAPGASASRYVRRELARIIRSLESENSTFNLHCMRAAGLSMRMEFERVVR
jgi:hypothetical protein